MNNTNKGFTFIEVIIYIALSSLLLGTAFVTVFQLIDSSNKLNVKNTVQEEGNFVMRKLNWALTGVSSFSNTLNTLHINKYDGNQIEIKLNDTKTEIQESKNNNNSLQSSQQAFCKKKHLNQGLCGQDRFWRRENNIKARTGRVNQRRFALNRLNE